MSATARKQGPISRSQSQALTREALLDAAEILILEQSIPGMSLRAVCTQAGFSQGASYSNFANREELLLAVMERNLEQKARSLEEMLSNCRNGDIVAQASRAQRLTLPHSQLGRSTAAFSPRRPASRSAPARPPGCAPSRR